MISDVVSDADLQMIREFADEPDKYKVAKTDFSGAQVADEPSDGEIPAAPASLTTYTPASSEILGILKGMLEAFTADLERSKKEEENNKQSYEDLRAIKKQEHQTLVATLE